MARTFKTNAMQTSITFDTRVKVAISACLGKGVEGGGGVIFFLEPAIRGGMGNKGFPVQC